MQSDEHLETKFLLGFPQVGKKIVGRTRNIYLVFGLFWHRFRCLSRKGDVGLVKNSPTPLREQLKAFCNRPVLYCFCFREKTPPRPQGQRPEPENRGVRKMLREASRNEPMALEVSFLALYFFLLDYKRKFCKIQKGKEGRN